MKVFLLGLPGCGKSTLAKMVAERLNRIFVDLDAEIVKGEQKSVAGIFESQGEGQFRQLEKKYLSQWCRQHGDFVMATGGGTPCFLSNMDLIKGSGVSIFLDTDVTEIANRMMKTELAKRPLFAGQDVTTIAHRVEEMRKQRMGFYEQSDIKLAGNRISANHIIEKILELEGKS